MTGVFVLLGGIALLVSIVTTLDLIARRQEQKNR
jgi:hypothetical protein